MRPRSSSSWPSAALHLKQSRPRTYPVSWSWSTCSDFPGLGARPQTAHPPRLLREPPVVVVGSDAVLPLQVRRAHRSRVVDRRLVPTLGLGVALRVRFAPACDSLDRRLRGVRPRMPALPASKVAVLALVAMAVAHALHRVERVERLGLMADATALHAPSVERGWEVRVDHQAWSLAPFLHVGLHEFLGVGLEHARRSRPADRRAPP